MSSRDSFPIPYYTIYAIYGISCYVRWVWSKLQDIVPVLLKFETPIKMQLRVTSLVIIYFYLTQRCDWARLWGSVALDIRLCQLAAIKSFLQGRDVFICLPTFSIS